MSFKIKYTLLILLIFGLISVVNFYIIYSAFAKDVRNETLLNLQNSVELSSKTLAKALENIFIVATSKSRPEWIIDCSILEIPGYGSVLEPELEFFKEEGAITARIFGIVNDTKYDVTIDFVKFVDTVITQSRYGYYYIVNSDGFVLYHNIKERIGINLKEVNLEDLLDHIIKEKKGWYKYKYEGENILVFFDKINLPFKSDKEMFLANASLENVVFSQIKKIRNFFLIVILPISLAIIFIGAYFISNMGVKKLQFQTNSIANFTKSVADALSNLSLSSSEIQKAAENTALSSSNLSELVQNFAASAEEGKMEINHSLDLMNTFLEHVEETSEMVKETVELMDSLNELNEKITDLSDVISILAINTSIESSKENIDREGIMKIADYIANIANDAKETTKISKKAINQVQEKISKIFEMFHRIEEEVSSARSAMKNILQVIDSLTEGVIKLQSLSENLAAVSQETNAGVEEIRSSLEKIREEVSELEKMSKKLKL